MLKYACKTRPGSNKCNIHYPGMGDNTNFSQKYCLMKAVGCFHKAALVLMLSVAVPSLNRFSRHHDGSMSHWHKNTQLTSYRL